MIDSSYACSMTSYSANAAAYYRKNIHLYNREVYVRLDAKLDRVSAITTEEAYETV